MDDSSAKLSEILEEISPVSSNGINFGGSYPSLAMPLGFYNRL